MLSTLLTYLAGRPDSATFFVPSEVTRVVDEIFPRAEWLLPEPYRIFPADETQPPTLGFPVMETTVIRELDARLDRWLADEIAWHISREQTHREKMQASFTAYLNALIKTAENALLSNLLSDYHAIFWLAHSADVAKHFAALPRRISQLDANTGRTQGDALKYRIYAKWATDIRDQMTQLCARSAATLDGEEQRGLQFFRLLQDDVLIFTEEFIGPDLRELRSFINGYLRRDFQAFRDTFEKLRINATDLIQKDKTFRAALPVFGVSPDQAVVVALLLDSRFQNFLFENQFVQNAVSREEREQFALIAKRVREFAVLNQLRRGIVWMTTTADGQIVSTDRRNSTTFSRSTRPLDFGRPGVVDPMVHRFGLIYDISSFSETLGNIRRGGSKSEISSYRQMVLFQRKLETIAQRHSLQFEKFLGDGAFYTTRRALRLVRAAVEIQRFYSEMKRKGFAFNKGLRIALNYGYYRLLPMKTSNESNERITEFYGPGIVELSRLTTGKATKEIEEIAAFLVSRGYDHSTVTTFFAPLKRGVDMVDHTQHAREFYAYINQNNNLINEGIVASMNLLQELSSELMNEMQPLYRLKAQWGTYIGFAPAVPGLEFVGIRLLGMVQLKGLDDVEVGEIAPFSASEVEATQIEVSESLTTILRQEFHHERDTHVELATGAMHIDPTTTANRSLGPELVLCVTGQRLDEDEVLIAEWDPSSDDLNRPLRIPYRDFQRLFAMKGDLTTESLTERKSTLRDLYHRLTEHSNAEAVPLGAFRREEYERFILGEVVERL
jgi:hypothetical protein